MRAQSDCVLYFHSTAQCLPACHDPTNSFMRSQLTHNGMQCLTLQVMKSPPAGVKLVMHAICIMLGCIPEAVQKGKVKDEEAIKEVRLSVCMCA